MVHFRFRLLPVAVVVGLFSATGCFVLERADGLVPGSIQGSVVKNDGSPAAEATVTLVGLRQTVRADANGRFRFTGVPAGGHALTATIDNDNDAIADEGALQAVAIERREGSLIGIDVGDVKLLPTGTLAGRLLDDTGAPAGGATVAIWRAVNLAVNGDGGETVTVDLPAERLLETNADGTFRAPGLIAGDAFFAGFDSVANVATRGAPPAKVTLLPGEVVTADDTTLFPIEGTVRAIITLVAGAKEEVEVRLAPTGKFAPEEPTLLLEANRTSVNVDVPVGVWDVTLTSGLFTAFYAGLVAPPGDGVVSWGIFELIEGEDVCGDGLQTGPERCDDGEANSDTAPNACRTDCTLPSCGDGITDTDFAETCDDADGNSDTAPNACRSDCTLPRCGDGVPDDELDEACDDGIANSDEVPNACRTDCIAPTCGDGVADDQFDEACDTGDARSDDEPDACRLNCVLPSCGDTIIDPALGEDCDLGVGNTTTCLPVGTDACTFCDPTTCVAGSVDPTADITVDVRSVQGWSELVLEDVAVNLGGRTVRTGADGLARFPATTLPVDEAILGDNVDTVAFTDRAFARQQLVLPALVHGDSVTVRAEVFEACAAPATGADTGDDTEVACPRISQPLEWAVGPGSLFQPGTTTPLAATDTYTVRVAVMPENPFDDLSIGRGLPETRTVDGEIIQCREAFDFRIDGADLNPDPTAALNLPNLAISDRPEDSVFRFDEAQRGYVAVPDAIQGDTVALTAAGSYCIGRAAPEDGCLNVTVDDTNLTPGEQVTLDIADSSYRRRRFTVVAGATTCLPFQSNTFPNVLATSASGRIGIAFVDNEVGFAPDLCGDPTACVDATVTFPDDIQSQCVNVVPQVFQDSNDDAPVLPANPVIVFDRRELTYYRSRILFTDPRRCILVPAETGALVIEAEDLTPECGTPFVSTSQVSNSSQSLLQTAAVCTDVDDTCNDDLGIADFCCNS